MDRPEQLGDNKATTDYIEYLEGCLNGANELQKELAYTCHILAEDLKLANGGKVSGFKLLSGNKDDKIFERIFIMVKNKTDLASLSLLPKSEREKEKGNAFEEVSKRISEKINGKGK